MLAKYEQLKLWLSVEGYNISAFNDDSIVEEYFLVDTQDEETSISVFVEDDRFRVLKEEQIEGEWYKVEDKYYKTPKGVMNMIKKILA